MCKAFTEFQERVHKIAFTDSVHSLYSADVNDTMRNWIVEVGYIYYAIKRRLIISFNFQHARNWVQSLSPLDTPTPQYSEREIPCVSAGEHGLLNQCTCHTVMIICTYRHTKTCGNIVESF